MADPGETGKKSIDILINELNLANQLNITGSIVHTGSFKSKVENLVCHDQENYPQLLANLKNVLNNSPINTYLILENAGTRKIGQTINQLAEIIKDVNSQRIRICLDTCHLHAAGYDIGDEKKLDKFLDNFDTKIGLEKLEVFHLNDSKDDFGSLRDRHENIGEGKVGIDVFKNLLNNPRTKSKSFIIETPGFDKKGPDKKNLDTLKELSR